ncbi:SIMPL domain-containing protein [Alteromonas gracilis]|uniref:SIMPL domain-containing protein n=1 Tax=Alteromonas gracilis TaxID=1479524 RepID=UPI0030CC489D
MNLHRTLLKNAAFAVKGIMLIVSVGVCGIAQAESGMINVQGSGAIEVTPNAYTVTFVIEQEGETVSKLNTQLASDLRKVVEFLLSQGVAQKNIQSMQVRLNPRYINSPQGRVQDGFTLSRDVVMTSTNLSTYDRVLDGVLKRGVDRIQQFNFIALNEQNVYEVALVAAIQDAKRRAQLVAKELGVEVGEVVAISESGGNMPIPVMRAEAFAKDMSMSLPGQQRVEARVSVSFKIVQ